MKQLTVKDAATTVMYSALTPAFILVERYFGISWPLTYISGTLMWLSMLLIALGVVVLLKVIHSTNDLATYDIHVRMDNVVEYSPLTLIVSSLLTFTVAMVLLFGGHPVLGVVGLTTFVFAITLHAGRADIRDRLYTMSWEYRAELKKLHDSTR